MSPQKKGTTDSKKTKTEFTKGIERSKTFKKDEILELYLKKQYSTLLIDVIALILVCAGYSIYLIYTEGFLGNIFLVFAIICCILIISDYVQDIKNSKKGVEEDLEILFK